VRLSIEGRIVESGLALRQAEFLRKTLWR
jgi:hypothetical protein